MGSKSAVIFLDTEKRVTLKIKDSTEHVNHHLIPLELKTSLDHIGYFTFSASDISSSAPSFCIFVQGKDDVQSNGVEKLNFIIVPKSKLKEILALNHKPDDYRIYIYYAKEKFVFAARHLKRLERIAIAQDGKLLKTDKYRRCSLSDYVNNWQQLLMQ